MSEDQRRDEILKAAERLLISPDSTEDVSLGALARELGVPIALSELPDPATLVREVTARFFDSLDVVVDEALLGIDDPVERLAARGCAYIRFGSANPEAYRLIFMGKPEPVSPGRCDHWATSRTIRELTQDIRACVETGRFQSDTTEPDQVVLAWWAAVHGLVSLMISGPPALATLWPSPLDSVDWYMHDYLRRMAA